MNLIWDTTIEVDGVDLEVTVEAQVDGERGQYKGFIPTQACVLKVELEGEDILPKLDRGTEARLEHQAVDRAQALDDEGDYNG